METPLTKSGDTAMILAIKHGQKDITDILAKKTCRAAATGGKNRGHELQVAFYCWLQDSSSISHQEILITLLQQQGSQCSDLPQSFLTACLNPMLQDLSVILLTAGMITQHAVSYPLRALLLATLMDYYPQLLLPLLQGGYDPTGITDHSLDHGKSISKLSCPT